MTRLSVLVQAGAVRDGLRGWRGDGALKLRVTAAPERGLANRAVRELLAGVLGVGVEAVRLERGAGSRSKGFEIDGLSEAEVKQRIDAALAAGRGSTHGE